MLRRSMLVGAMALGAAAQAQPLDPSAVAFRLPDQIPWGPVTRNGNQQAVLLGDPARPGPYIVMVRWQPNSMSRPHFHPNDRFITVVAGTWWVGSGTRFDPNATVPMPAGSFVTHFGRGIHYDGAKDEPCTILIMGEGPGTSTPAEAPR